MFSKSNEMKQIDLTKNGSNSLNCMFFKCKQYMEVATLRFKKIMHSNFMEYEHFLHFVWLNNKKCCLYVVYLRFDDSAF